METQPKQEESMLVDDIPAPKDKDEALLRIFLLKHKARVDMWIESHATHEKLPIIKTFDGGYAWLNRKARRHGTA